jgi:hypothetical protein
MPIMPVVATFLRPALQNPVIRRIRRNHAFEHATIHMLNRQRFTLSGNSNVAGFVLIGDVPTDKVENAAKEALRRLRGGESQLAIHPNCGTNLVVAGLLTTTIAALGFTGTTRRSAWERYPIIMLLMMFAALYSQPLGMVVQQYITTEGDPGDLELVSVTRRETHLPVVGKFVVHDVKTTRG